MSLKSHDLPDEVSNLICSYMEGSTNQIMKTFGFFQPIKCLKINKEYKFKHLNIKRLLDAVNTKCHHCLNRLNPQEFVYKSIHEIWSHKKLCSNCLQREQFRIVFEASEIVLMLIITIYMIGSILYFSSIYPIERR
jgi:hypothetical protein